MGPPAGCGPEGYVAVGRALLSDQGAAGPSTRRRGRGPARDGTGRFARALAGRYQRAVSESLAALAEGTLPDRPDAEARAVLLAWLVEHGLLDLDDDVRRPARRAPRASFREIEAASPEPRAPGHGRRARPRTSTSSSAATPRRRAGRAPPDAPGLIAGDDQPPAPADGSGRLELARRIADPANPLTARVLVNRVWHHLFGRGLVASVDNFGALGEPPDAPGTARLPGRPVRPRRLVGQAAGPRAGPEQHVPAWPARPTPEAEAGRPGQPAAAPDARPPAGGRGHPRRDPGRLRPARPPAVSAPASRST